MKRQWKKGDDAAEYDTSRTGKDRYYLWIKRDTPINLINMSNTSN